jgi:bacterioferritin-associated ferredoxin
MYVCLCKGITDTQIREAASQGASSLSQVRRQLGIATCCGKCAATAKEILNEHRTNEMADNSLYYSVA